jgi:pyruvate/2-oxoglutarate dehydrogenase complex dihydrolipoamide dehydrogenase (E3) component
MLAIAQLLTHAQAATRYGAQVTDIAVDWAAVQARIREVQNDMRGGTPTEAVAAMRERGIDLFCEAARFVSPHAVQVGEATIQGDQIVIATGAEAVVPPIPGLDQAGYLTNREIIYLEQLPARLAIIGGGPIGVEFAQLFRRFGVAVVLVEEDAQLLPKDDIDVAAALTEVLTAEGIDIHRQTKLTQVSSIDGRKELTLTSPDGTLSVTADALLIAAGRAPTIAGLQLDRAGVRVEDGAIVVNETLQTSVEHIWSVGDVTGGYPFTHVANAQGRYVAQRILQQRHDSFNRKATPWVTYTAPEVAHVGQTEAELQKGQLNYRVGKAMFADVARAQATGNTAGLVKLLVGADDQILGCHIAGEGAGELIAPIVLAMRNHLPFTALGDIILPYPTMVQALQKAALDIT